MPTLNVITSSSQRHLLEALAGTMRSNPLPPLEHEHIVVLSNGMARWISMELAVRLGVAAGLEFSFPNDLLDRSFAATLPNSPSSIPFTTISLTWRIASHLPTLSNQAGFEQVASYLGTNNDDRRLLQISRSLAGCFDQYIIFRPEMVCAWDEGKGDEWQARLWRAVTGDLQGEHRAALLAAVQRHVAGNIQPVNSLPRRIALFGISYLPPFHLEALRLLAHYSDITCYLLNPCGQYWGTIISEKRKSSLALQPEFSREAEEYYETGNPLLSSLGTLGQEFFESLLDYGFETEEMESLRHTPDTILATIQSDILTLFDRPSGNTKVTMAADDRSVQIHSCHSPLREMEILYDNLLSVFDELPDLEPRNIVIMIPDIEAYAPYISSVFGNRSSGRPPLPFTIADRSIQQESPFVSAFLKMLATASGRFTLHEILDLLEIPVVMNRFDINDDERSIIKTWLIDCNVRWGLDSAHRADLGFLDYADFSWRAGMDRLFLGYAMAPDDSATFNGILPYPASSGSRVEALGKLAEFIAVLKKWGQRMRTAHIPAEWADIFTAAIEQTLQPDENDARGAATVAKAMGTLRNATSLYGFNQPIALDAIQEHLAELMTNSSGGYGFLGGAITFCAMLPMRSIPMRVVWLAGMNDGVFPRTEKQPGFNLMNGTRRRGDRSLRDEDRYLFLEALMAAEDRLCISYTGQSHRDNSTLPPSVLVAELTDYIMKSFVSQDGTSPTSVLVHHRLQGFSPLYFNGNNPSHLFSYDRDTCQALEARRVSGRTRQAFIEAPLPLDIAFTRQIDLQQLARFLTNPAAVFLEQRLKVIPFNPAEEPEDAEPFAMDALARYSLSQELVSNLLAGADYDDCLTAARSRSILPPLSTGRIAFDTLWEKSRQFVAELGPKLGAPLEPLKVTFDHGSTRLCAVLENSRSGSHARWRCAGMKGKDRLVIWLEHLLLNIAKADGYPTASTLIASDTILELPPLDNAPQILSDLIDVYCDGLQRPLRFFPETSWAFLHGGQTKAEKIWRGDQQRGFYGESSNQSVALCFGNEEPWADEFSKLAEQIYGPLINVIKQSS